jgi:hypothetical protein
MQIPFRQARAVEGAPKRRKEGFNIGRSEPGQPPERSRPGGLGSTGTRRSNTELSHRRSDLAPQWPVIEEPQGLRLTSGKGEYMDRCLLRLEDEFCQSVPSKPSHQFHQNTSTLSSCAKKNLTQ